MPVKQGRGKPFLFFARQLDAKNISPGSASPVVITGELLALVIGKKLLTFPSFANH
ncbi:MAG: hypothetical protein IGS39_14955 [Calothrix sp. C42_A2020_038]|nr:hypothetical protein [Calothrix sp. C42_A2020_038]